MSYAPNEHPPRDGRNGHAPGISARLKASGHGDQRLPTGQAPHNLEAEQALLGAILVNNEAMARVSSFLEPLHFYDPLHQQIYETTAKLIHAGKRATPITLRTFFENAEPISANLTVPQYLGTLAANATTIINAEDYGRTVYDLATRRALIIIGEDIVNGAYDSSVDSTPQLQIEEAYARLEKVRSTAVTSLRLVTADGLLAADLQPRAYILTRFLQERGTAMVYAWRGIGKTWFSLALGYAVASGGEFLRWSAEKPRPVLHVCGEMPAVALRERLWPIAKCGPPLPSADHYRIVSADLHEHGLPDLASREGQAALDAVMGDAALIILDNVSTLFRSGVENEAESWLPVQQWLLRLRRNGRAVVLVHHANKGRAQRGTSRREDILDLVLNLRAPQDYEASEGARFEVHFEKARGLTGSDVDPFEARLEIRDAGALWTMKSLEDTRLAEISELVEAGRSVRDIATELGMSKSAVQRAKARIRTTG